MDEMLQISLVDARKLIAAASGDAALLYLYLKSGAEPAKAAKELHMSSYQLELATASLRQLGLLPKQQHLLPTEERPVYTERDVANRIENGADFTKLVDEMQYTLGRVLSTEDMKILLGWTDYLGMTPDVIHILVNYCMNRNKLRGILRTPTFRTMEKEAYYWADNGIETMEQAAAFAQNRINTQQKVSRVAASMQISGRRLTQAEEKYIRCWLDMGFDLPEIMLAYERTCLNAGGLKWQYMHKILQNWHNQNLHSVAGIQASDNGPAPRTQADQPKASPIAAAAIARMLQEEQEQNW